MKKAVFVLVSLMIAACNSTPKNNAPAAQADTKQNAQASASAAGKAEASNDAQADVVFFATNDATVSPSYRSVIQHEAESIKGQKHKLVLEGNCDERGSDEYNLALGQRRADAVKKLLVAAGVHASQVKASSLGKEKPKATCHDESCWKENRRVDFVQG